MSSTSNKGSEEVSDYTIKKEIWYGCVPIEFTLAPHEVTTYETPAPYYVLVHRQSYLPLYTNSVKKHFEAAVAAFDRDQIWFSDGDVPLKWNIPAGVLFDLINTSNDLPWKVTVHFHGFPSKQIMRCEGEETVQFNYLNNLKEALFIKHGTTKGIMTLSKPSQTKLWESIKTCDLAAYEQLLSTMNAGETVKHFPIRLYRGTQNPPRLLSMSPLDDHGEERTLRTFLREVIPTENPDDLASKIIIQGVTPSLDTPLRWLMENFIHPDQFLHICVME